MGGSNPRPTTIDEYIASFPAEIGDTLQTLRRIINEEAPGVKETIKYNMPAFVLHSNLIFFAAWKTHISIYPITTEMEAVIVGLADYEMSGKGTIRFSLDQPLPLSLIREIVAFRVRENLARNR